MSSKLWSRSTVYTTLAMGKSLPPEVKITFERTTWILGLHIEARSDLRATAGDAVAASQ